MAGKNDQNFNQSTLEEWKLKMFLDIAGMRDMDGHTKERKKKNGEVYHGLHILFLLETQLKMNHPDQ